MRRTFLVVAVALALSLGGQQAFAAPGDSVVTAARQQQVTVGGAVSRPATYPAAAIRAMPQLTVMWNRRHGSTGPVSGASVEALVLASDPVLPAGKNTQLRASITVAGERGRRVTVALGELDAAFGNHPALLTVDDRGRVGLVIPGDATGLRSVQAVTSIDVTVSAAGASTPTAAGSVRVTVGRRVVDASAATLARLPRRTVTVLFQAGTVEQTHTETGPPLAAVLLAAGVLPVPDAAVTAVGSDGYGATVTLGEALLGGRPLLLGTVEDGAPLAQPRLIPDGDVKGGRYVSGVVTLSVTGAGKRLCR